MQGTSTLQFNLLYRVSKRLRPWIVCLSASLFFFYEFIQMNMFNAIGFGLMQTFAIDATQLGNLSAMYLYSTVLVLFPIGLLLDRFSTRTLILTAMIVCITGTFCFALSTSLLMAQIFRFIAGAGGAFCFLSSLMLASRWFESRQMAMITGVIVTIAMVGGVMAQTPLTLLTEAFGWRKALMFNVGLGVFIWLIIWSFVQDFPIEKIELYKGIKKQHYELGFFKSIKLALYNKQAWLGGLYTSLLNLPILLLGALWGSHYLVQVHGLSKVDSSYVTTMIFFGTVIGSPTIGWFSDYIQLRKVPMYLGAIVSLFIVVVIIYIPSLSFMTLILLFFFLGFFSSSQIISYPLVVESTPRPLIGASEGITSAVIMSGGAISQPLFGKLLDLNWDGAIADGIRVYSVYAYKNAMFTLPLAFVICILLLFIIKETYCKLRE